MILVDRRSGSRELVPYLKALRVPISETTLAFGDFAFTGRGPKEGKVEVCVERKTLGDLVTSMQSGRFVGQEENSPGQLRGMLQTYDIPLLLVEGVWRPDREGLIEVLYTPKNQRGPKREMSFWVPFRGNIPYRAVSRFLFTILFKARVPYIRTTGLRETAQTLFDLHAWWTAKGWDQHRSHLALDRTFDPRPDAALWRDPNFPQQVASKFPGIWEVRSEAAAEHFGSVHTMVNASVEEWAEVEGIGELTATRLYNKLRQVYGKRGRAVRARTEDRDARRPAYKKGGDD